MTGVPANTVLRLPRRLLWAIRSRYDETTTAKLLQMMWHHQREQAHVIRMGRGVLPIPFMLGVTAFTPGGPAPWQWVLTAAVVVWGGSIAVRAFRQARAHGVARIAIMNEDQAGWQAILQELIPVERECIGADAELESVSVPMRP